jgi:hypothetical protein
LSLTCVPAHTHTHTHTHTRRYEPSFDDNVKQDKSIDVYDREFDDQVDALANA